MPERTDRCAMLLLETVLDSLLLLYIPGGRLETCVCARIGCTAWETLLFFFSFRQSFPSPIEYYSTPPLSPWSLFFSMRVSICLSLRSLLFTIRHRRAYTYSHRVRELFFFTVFLCSSFRVTAAAASIFVCPERRSFFFLYNPALVQALVNFSRVAPKNSR